jgi:hypothetical protein
MSRKEILLAQVSAYLILAKELKSMYYYRAAVRTFQLVRIYDERKNGKAA